VSYSVEIRGRSTGETVTREYPEFEWVASREQPGEEGNGSRYWWTDGNFGCDCNRELEFRRGKGEIPEVGSSHCTIDQPAFLVRITLPDGRVVLDEFEGGET
jgi:hypothetical protein